MRKSQNVQERYYSALDELYGILKQVPSTRQLVAKAGGSNSTAEKYTIIWCGERGIKLQVKEKKKLPQDLEEAIEKEIEERVLEGCIQHSEESKRLSEENEQFRTQVNVLKESAAHLENELKTATSTNLNLVGQLTQIEGFLDDAKKTQEREKKEYEIKIEEFRVKATDADEKRIRAEGELTIIPELNKRAEIDLLVVEALKKSLDRENFFESLALKKLMTVEPSPILESVTTTS
ncbi:MAG: hypothetical protein EOP04_07535 [Proteobacteria bacterium]|nr:MAG: hypothetical protein EOP04_07535 [Pseudomonadota bacterium]